jgi:hypothetical protein
VSRRFAEGESVVAVVGGKIQGMETLIFKMKKGKWFSAHYRF